MNKLHIEAKTIMSLKASRYNVIRCNLRDQIEKITKKLDLLRKDKNWSWEPENTVYKKYNKLWTIFNEKCDLRHKMFDCYMLAMKHKIMFKGKCRKLYSSKLDNIYYYYVIYRGLKHVVKPLKFKSNILKMEIDQNNYYDRFKTKIS